MTERPAPNELTLTLDERRLCFFYAGLWIGVIALAGVLPQAFRGYVRVMVSWMNRRIEPLLNGELPVFSVDTFLELIVTTFVIGAAILGALHFACLVKFGRWLRPATLWFWTMLHAVLPALFVVVFIVDNLLSFVRTGRSDHQADFFIFLVFVAGLPLVVAFVSRRLWRRRRVAKKRHAE